MSSILDSVLLSDVRASTARYFDMDERSLTQDTRYNHITHARQIGMFVCRDLTGKAYKKVARTFNRVDHTTAIYAFRKISAALDRGDESVVEVVTAIRDAARARAAKRIEVEGSALFIPQMVTGEVHAHHA